MLNLNFNYSPNGKAAGLEETGEEEVSKFYLNSLKNSLFIPENVKADMDEVNYLYKTQTNEGQLKQAAINIGEDLKGVINRIRNAKSLESGVQSAEALLITKHYIDIGKLTGDYSKALEFTKMIRPKITTTAQSLQALSMFTRFTA